MKKRFFSLLIASALLLLFAVCAANQDARAPLSLESVADGAPMSLVQYLAETADAQ